MQWGESLSLWPISDVEANDPAIPLVDRKALAEIADWSREFLVPNHPDLGRQGPVCPFTKPSMERGLFFLACPRSCDSTEAIKATVLEYRDWYRAMSAELDERERELLTFLLLFSGFDRGDSSQLDLLQGALKEDFIQEGLMIGQFHPVCEQSGIWNDDFRPLRAPLPLLAVRQMVPFDLPFLTDNHRHFDNYMRTFAPEIPVRIRSRLVDLLQDGRND